jgi:fructose-bisphosphate aldolase, class II
MQFKLLETLKAADQSRTAIGHFNVSDSVLLQAVTSAARDAGLPVIIGLSESERKFFGVREAAAMANALRESHAQQIFVNADHTHSLESAIPAVKAGFDSVVFDRSALPFEQNIRETRQAVEALKSINPAVVFEGEIGDIGTGSKIHDKAPDRLILTSAEKARQFIQKPSGRPRTRCRKHARHAQEHARRDDTKAARPRADPGVEASDWHLHDSSRRLGTNDRDLQESIQSGMTIIHVNTELRVAWRKALEKSLVQDEAEIVPYKILAEPFKAVQAVVRQRLDVFDSRATRAHST